MEGMVALESLAIQAGFLCLYGIRGNAQNWATKLSMKLLECTLGQWL
jgi:hypothetical protein